MEVYDAAAEAIRGTEPYGALMTAHLNGEICTPAPLNERDRLDFHMYQSGHSNRSKERARSCAEVVRGFEPARPVLNIDTGRQYVAEWFNPRTGEKRPAHVLGVDGNSAIEAAPWQGDAALLLQLSE